MLTSTAHAAAGKSLPYSMWWNPRSSSPLILLGYPSCSPWRWEGSSHGRLSLPAHWPASRPLADAAVRGSGWSVWRESSLWNAECHRGPLPPLRGTRGRCHRAWPHTEPSLRSCVCRAVWFSDGNSSLSFAGFNSWNSMDLHVTGRKTLRASGCYVEERVFFSEILCGFASVFAFGFFCFVVFEVISSMPFRTQQVYFPSILLLTHYQIFKRERN